MIKMLWNQFYQLFSKSATSADGIHQVIQYDLPAILRLGGIIFLMVIVTACGGGTSTPSKAAEPEQAVRLNNAFVVQVGQSAVLEDEPLKITFDSVLQDIRCPSRVTCSEKGFARILVVVQLADQNSSTYEMNTEPFYKANMGLGVNKISHEGYEIQLTALNPYPESPDDELNFDVYEATFVVTKTGGQ
jgi:hypothetical protein